MPIPVTCTNCQKAIKAPDNLAGKRVKCPQCGTVLAIPGGAPAAAAPPRKAAAGQGAAGQRPAARAPAPGGAPQPGMRPPAGAPRPAAPPGRPAPMAAFGGVADLIDEEITRQTNKKIKEEEDEIQRQAKEKAWNELMAPKLKSLEMQKKGRGGIEGRKISVGKVMARSWRVYTADFGRLLGMTTCAAAICTIPGLLAVPLFMLVGVITAVLGKAMGEGAAFAVGVVGFLCAAVGLFVLVSLPLVSWLLTGLAKFVMSRIKGKKAEFADLFRGGKRMISTWGASLMCSLYLFMPLIPLALGVIAIICVALTSLEEDTKVRTVQIVSISASALMLLLGVLGQILFVKSLLFLWAIADRNAKAHEAIGISQQLTDGNFWKMRLLMTIVGLLITVGLMTCGIGMIFAQPFILVMWGVTYAELSGIEEPLPGETPPEQPA